MGKIHSIGHAKIQWAPIYVEPLHGSGERITMGVCAIVRGKEPIFKLSADSKTLRRIFHAQEYKYLSEAAEMVGESFLDQARKGVSLNDWIPPLAGVEVGAANTSEVSDDHSQLEEFLASAMRLTSCLYHPNTSSSRRVNWSKSIRETLIDLDKRLAPMLNAKVSLARYDVVSEFEFLSHSYAANLVSFGNRRISDALREARAKAWSLDQLPHAPDLLFRPANRELIAGISNSLDDKKKVEEALDEMCQEAARRNIGVVTFDSPKEAAAHIFDMHSEAA
ncbi:MAG: hypothetical protein OXE81_09875 [Gammaproteobacteria bacterium]|nr:hypothetical protein [Gammaproteobacteria bacterium]